jgi:hypothetical protein
VKHLELLANSRTGAPAGSLFGVLNQTSTSVGAALLRAQVGRRCATPGGGATESHNTSPRDASCTGPPVIALWASGPLLSAARSSQLLSPVNDADTLEVRLNCVDELLRAEQVRAAGAHAERDMRRHRGHASSVTLLPSILRLTARCTLP